MPAIRRRIVAVMVRILIHIGHLVAQGPGRRIAPIRSCGSTHNTVGRPDRSSQANNQVNNSNPSSWMFGRLAIPGRRPVSLAATVEDRRRARWPRGLDPFHVLGHRPGVRAAGVVVGTPLKNTTVWWSSDDGLGTSLEAPFPPLSHGGIVRTLRTDLW